MIDPRDNHEYKIVTIGEQIWMAENLAYLPSVSKPEAAATSDGDPLYFVFNYDGEDVNAAKATKEYKTYGVLYNWYAAMNQKNATGGDAEAIPSGIQGICPSGWHLPSKAEWKKLESFVVSELAPVEGNVWTDEDGNKYSDKDCKNVWSALTGKLDTDGWGESGMIDEILTLLMARVIPMALMLYLLDNAIIVEVLKHLSQRVEQIFGVQTKLLMEQELYISVI